MMEALDQELNMLNSKVVLTNVCPYFMDSNEDITNNINIRFIQNKNKYYILYYYTYGHHDYLY